MTVSTVWSEIDTTTLEMRCAFDRFPGLRGLTYRLPAGETARVIGTDCLSPATRVLVETDDGRRWSVDAERLTRRMNTRVFYMYRDASNYKFHGAVVLEGLVTEEQIRPHLHEGQYFISGDVGLPDLHPTYCTFDADLDHPWHELNSVKPTGMEPTIALTAEDFLRSLREAARAEWPGQHEDFAWE